MPKEYLRSLRNATEAYLCLAYSFRLPSVDVWKVDQEEFFVYFEQNQQLDLANFIRKSIQNYAERVNELIWEYTRLFIGPYHLSCPPYESVYRDSKQIVMSQHATGVWKYYDRAGLTMSSDLVEPPDHISLELEFISNLLSRAIRLKAKRDYYLSLKDEFLSEHVLRWVPQFCGDVKSHAKLDYYYGLADLCLSYLG